MALNEKLTFQKRFLLFFHHFNQFHGLMSEVTNSGNKMDKKWHTISRTLQLANPNQKATQQTESQPVRREYQNPNVPPIP